MENFINYSPFPALLFDSLDQNDQGFSTLVARISYELDPQRGMLTLCDDQGELVEQDEHYGEPGRSSVRRESDLAPYKPKMDVVINATAWAPANKPTPKFVVGAAIGQHVRLINVYGERIWRKGIGYWSLSEPKPLLSLPIRYENAQGGYYALNDGQTWASPTNTVGIGWLSAEANKALTLQKLSAPQLELLPHPIKKIDDTHLPAGFGFIGRGWQPRLQQAGTYDERWKETRHPFLPADFSFNYWCGAHPWLQFPLPEPLTFIPFKLKNLISAASKADQEVFFSLPVETLFAFVTTTAGAGVSIDLRLDTVVVDMEAAQVNATYRAVFSEELDAALTELRFIDKDQRQSMVEESIRQRENPEEKDFLPLPPSLFEHSYQESKDGR